MAKTLIKKKYIFLGLKKFPELKNVGEDLAGDNKHYSVTIESSKCNGLSRIQQHQLVYQSLEGLMDSELHAMQLKTKGTI